jgi:predicted MFS family arabinose efflux permease
MAVFNLAFNGGVTVAAFAGGEIAERLGYSALWLAAGTCAATGAFFLFLPSASLRRP